MLKYNKDFEALLSFAETMGRAVAMGADEQAALAKLQGAIIMYMIIKCITSSMYDRIYNIVFDRYQDSFIAYFEEEKST